MIAAPSAAMLALANPAGRFADDRAAGGRRRAMRGGMALIALADVGTAAAGSLASLVAARLALGAGRVVSETGWWGGRRDTSRRLRAVGPTKQPRSPT